ncbi:hypothetical protein GCM10010460_26920 [Microbacterium terrae]|uniref:Integral membrane protein n=2 Tax=Microbacterium terrae TaxID=69369 RepID=A0A0M2H5M6_9MICO|nr:hypothetical protein RS81_02224 [Microbacterium terrae]GLJ99882.1 hypothetical protein GCM10017594_30800 [Microbacterium terrae]
MRHNGAMTDAAAPTQPLADNAALAARIRELEAENARLTAGEASPTAPQRAKAAGSRWRAFLSALCIVIATILVPVSIVTAWARLELVDETRFVETFAPLADDPHVQALVADQVTTAIDESIDLEGVTDDLFDGLQGLDLPPRALDALELLRAPAAQGLQGLVDTTVTRLVESDAFADVWETTLRASHRALEAVAAGGTANGAVVIGDGGELGIQLAPIIEEVKERLIDRGIGFASSIPVIEKTIVVAQSDALAIVGTVYNLAVAAGWWMPVIALVLFLAGILIARRRSTALLGTGVGITVGAGVLSIALAIAGSVLALSAPNLGVSSAALASIYQQVTGDMRDTATVFIVLGLLLIVIGWLSGRWRGARATRDGVASVNSGLRGSVRGHGLDTGGFGAWMYAQRVLVRVVLAVLAVLWLILLRPLSLADVFLVVIVWLVVWWLTELVQVRPDEAVTIVEDADVAAAEPVDATVIVTTPGDDTAGDTLPLPDDLLEPTAAQHAAAAPADTESGAAETADAEAPESPASGTAKGRAPKGGATG